jgi:hypothetical protein
MGTIMKANGSVSDLEQRLAAALADQRSTADQLKALIAETQEAVLDAEEKAATTSEAAFDPIRAPDLKVARAAMEDAALALGRLNTLLSRLIRRHVEVATRERAASWTAAFHEARERRDALAAELAELYPAAVRNLMNLFIRISACDNEIDRLHQARPSGVSLHLDSVELTARGLDRFTRDRPALMNTLTLFDLNSGKQLWPQIIPRDMSVFAPTIPVIPSRSPDWWKPEVQAARQAEAAAEAKRVAEYYEKQKAQQQERANSNK